MSHGSSVSMAVKWSRDSQLPAELSWETACLDFKVRSQARGLPLGVQCPCNPSYRQQRALPNHLGSWDLSWADLLPTGQRPFFFWGQGQCGLGVVGSGS